MMAGASSLHAVVRRCRVPISGHALCRAPTPYLGYAPRVLELCPSPLVCPCGRIQPMRFTIRPDDHRGNATQVLSFLLLNMYLRPPFENPYRNIPVFMKPILLAVVHVHEGGGETSYLPPPPLPSPSSPPSKKISEPIPLSPHIQISLHRGRGPSQCTGW